VPSSNFVSAMMIPAAQRVLGGGAVQRDRDVLDLREALGADELGGLVAADVLVVAGLRLRRRGEDRLRQAVRLA